MKGETMKNLFLIFILVAVIIGAGCVKENQNTLDTPPRMTTTPTTIFPTFTTITPIPTITFCKGICNGTCYQMGQDCCGNLVYNYSDSMMCCGGRLSKSEDGVGCCENRSYDEKTQHCCNWKITPGGPFYMYMNCGNTCYKLDTQTCFKGQVYQGGHRDCGEVLCSEGMKCCNDKYKGPVCYNPNTQYCEIIFNK